MISIQALSFIERKDLAQHLPKIHAYTLEHIGVTAMRSKAWDGIDFIKNDLTVWP